MSQFPETRISLILRLGQASDVEAWREFALMYAPAVFRLARGRGLQPADAEDFAQELLLAVAQAAGRWQPDKSRASFRTWLFRVARNLLVDHFQLNRRRADMLGDHRQHRATAELIDPMQTEAMVQEAFDLEYRRAMFHRAAVIVRERVSDVTWSAFASTAVDAVPAAAVSQQLGIAVGSVYVARSRVMKMLRSEIERLQSSTALENECNADQGDTSLKKS